MKRLLLWLHFVFLLMAFVAKSSLKLATAAEKCARIIYPFSRRLLIVEVKGKKVLLCAVLSDKSYSA